MLIQEIIARRTDLSTFLVHLTRTFDGISGRDRLHSIILADSIEAMSPFGHAVSRLQRIRWDLQSQDCVCFTETPLQHLSLLTQGIEGRRIQFEPYGIVITKRQGRRFGVNPIWYLDITPGHTWLTNPVNILIERAIAANSPEDAIFDLTPYIEQFGKGAGRLKDFSWEREWRTTGSFELPHNYIVICPEREHEEFRLLLRNVKKCSTQVSLIDAHWGLEEIIATLAGFGADDIGAVSAN